MKVKIIATIGPATRKLSSIKLLAKNGMNIGRINMKHASISEAKKVCNSLHKAKVKVLVDIETNRNLKQYIDVDFDYLALSFCENAKQIKEIRKVFCKKVFVIAKIESMNGIRNLHNIISEADGVMVARGDLGKHISLEKLPLFQYP